MKKMIGVALVSAMLGMAPILAFAQVGNIGSPNHTMKSMPAEQTTTIETMHKKNGHITGDTKKVYTKKPMHKATHKVKTGHSAVREKYEGAYSNNMKHRHHKKHHTMHRKMGQTNVTTGHSAVRQAPMTYAYNNNNNAPVKKTNKVGQAFHNAGNTIHQDWDKMTHKKQ